MAAGSIVGWAIGGAVVGILATTLGSVVGEVAGGNEGVRQIVEKLAQGGTLQESTITIFFTMLGILAACCAVQTVVRARQEEAHGTAEPVLAAAVARMRWLADYLIVATCAVAIITVAATGAALAGLASSGADAVLYRVVLVDALGELVAASVFTAITALVFVVLPRATIGLAWALVLVGTMLGLFGPLFGLPEWTTHLSPFGVTPVMSGNELQMRGLWWLVLAVAVGAAASLTLMRRRALAADG
jgi:ABC-2 type transport system permease protein